MLKLFLTPNLQCQSTEGRKHEHFKKYPGKTGVLGRPQVRLCGEKVHGSIVLVIVLKGLIFPTRKHKEMRLAVSRDEVG